jgi:hypothetical protein
MSEWRNDPATEKQKDKLRFFGCTFDEGITKGQASDAISECVRRFPEREKEYQDRPPTKEQLSKLRRYLKKRGEKLEEYSEPDDPLTYGQAKDLIEELEVEEQQAALGEMDKEYIIDVGGWAELYPGLSWKRVQDAAKLLDRERPGWRNERNHIDLMLEKVAQLNPQLLQRWQRKAAPKRRAATRRTRKGAGGSALVFLIIVIWILWKVLSK